MLLETIGLLLQLAVVIAAPFVWWKAGKEIRATWRVLKRHD